MGSVTGVEAGLIRLEIALKVEDRFGITIPEDLDWQTVRDILGVAPGLPGGAVRGAGRAGGPGRRAVRAPAAVG